MGGSDRMDCLWLAHNEVLFSVREKILRSLYKVFPFDLRGDCDVPPAKDGIKISCIINFYGRLDLLAGILHSLAEQKFPRNAFEVILIEDRGGTDAGKGMAVDFSRSLPIVYAPLEKNFGLMGYARNVGLAASRGEYILFLDDDTVILQKDFFKSLVETFERNPVADAVIPYGRASYALIKGRYDSHDSYFMTNRCMAYRRDALSQLGGFVSDFIGQEDVEFAIRFTISGKKAINDSGLNYMHPPLIVNSLSKPRAVGASFVKLRKRYSFPIWLMALLNGCRWVPLILSPSLKQRMQGRFALGFLNGVVLYPFRKKLTYG